MGLFFKDGPKEKEKKLTRNKEKDYDSLVFRRAFWSEEEVIRMPCWHRDT